MGGGGGGGGGQIVIHNHHHVYLDGKEISAKMVPHLMDPMVAHIRNATGIRH
jgi:hypothetical protein